MTTWSSGEAAGRQAPNPGSPDCPTFPKQSGASRMLCDVIDQGHRPEGQERHGTLRLLDVQAMRRQPPPRVPWIVPGLLARGMLTLLTGEAGEGKSLIALAIAAALESQDDFGHLPVEAARTLIVDAENGEHELHRRIDLMGISGTRVEIAATDGFDLARDHGNLADLVEDVGPDLVILDSFRSLWPSGNENDSGEATDVLAGIRSILHDVNAAGLLLHHLPKSSAAYGRTSSGDYRGASAIRATVDLAFRLERASGDPESGRRKLQCFKSRPAATPDPMWLRLDEHARVEAAAPYQSKKASPRTDELQRRLLPALAGHGPMTLTELARQLGEKPDNRTLRTALERESGRGAIEQTSDGLWAAWRGAEALSDVATYRCGDNPTRQSAPVEPIVGAA
jgi:AAA domain-containing protein